MYKIIIRVIRNVNITFDAVTPKKKPFKSAACSGG